MFELGAILIIAYVLSLILYGTIVHSGQEIAFVSQLEISYTEAGAIISNARIIPVDCIVKEETIQVAIGTQTTHNFVLSVGSLLGSDMDEILDNEADMYYLPTAFNTAGGGQIEYMSDSLPWHLYIEAALQFLWETRRGSDQFVEAGSIVQTLAYFHTLGQTLTGGVVIIMHTLKLHVVAYRRGRGKGYKEPPAHVGIFLWDNSGSIKAGWVAPIDCRLGNMRFLYTGSEDTFFIGIGQKINLNTDMPGADAEQNLISGDDLIVTTPLLTSTGYSGATAYDKRIKFYRRGEVMGIVADSPGSVLTLLEIHFEMIPNFNAQGTYAVELESITEGDNWDSYYHIPFAMYVELLEIDWSASSVGYRGKFHVAHTTSQLVTQTEGSEFYYGGNLLGDPELINDAKKQDFVLDTIPVVVNVVDSVPSTNYASHTSIVYVGRYMKQGDYIMFFKEDQSGSLTAFEFDVKLTYRSRVKRSIGRCFDYMSGNNIYNHNEGVSAGVGNTV